MDDIAASVGEARGKVYFDKFRGIMSEFAADEETLMHQRKQANDDTVSMTYSLAVGCIIAGLVIGLMIALSIGGQIAGPIVQMTESVGELAGGNKKTEIPGWPPLSPK
jgi:methyl-accepting chemotaxis protein